MINQLISEIYRAETGRSIAVKYDEGNVYYDADFVSWLQSKIAIQMVNAGNPKVS